uniref:Disease resistance R13L4/SHOC-2-like LRR domain-containing protein n=1 Tax=Chenopodium quinoa TaxID=63459 RepID=A0A803KTD2_CHEQI
MLASSSISRTMNPLVNSLINHGNRLATLKDVAKSRSSREIIHESVIKEVEDLLLKLKKPQLPGSFPDTIIPKIIDKIQATVQTFIKLDSDNAAKYEYLAKKINDWKSKKQSSTTLSVPKHLRMSPTGDSTYQPDSSTVDDHQFQQLTNKKKTCLICWSLFPAGTEIQRRQLIYWWIGMDLITDQIEGDNILADFVDKEFIECTIMGNKILCNSYKMNENVHSIVVQAISSFGNSVTERNFWSRMSSLSKQTKGDDNVTPTMSLVINKGENSLSGETLEWLNKMKNVKVLHLGSWVRDPKNYIVVEDIETLKGLKNMGQLTCLSLQGISGIVELPESVYKLDNLKILDLRACPNLESLSEGIESLKQLTHLDLSECYLLDHVPNGISSLTKLQVLKGFVINPEDDPQQAVDNGNGKINNNKMKKKVSSMATFSDLSNLKELVKLTIRTRRMKFPTIQDFDTLLAMDKLKTLGILWVRSSSAVVCPTPTRRFPKSLEKLELQAAPKDTLSSLLRCICKDKESSLQKLYIRGGQVLDLGMVSMEMHSFCNVHTVRLRYLPELTIHWGEFRKFFPKLTRLQVWRCPNLIAFPCDENGLWVETN